MRRSLPILPALVCSLSLAFAMVACNLNVGQPQNTTSDNNPTPGNGTVIAATSSIPTSTASAASGGLPNGTLILVQVGNTIAQPPKATGQTISLPPERTGNQSSPDAHYGVRFERNGSVNDLYLVDFSSNDAKGKAVPQGAGLAGPGVTWKPDNSGFAFYDNPPTGSPKVAGIQYYDVASGQTKSLVPASSDPGSVTASIAFSPDGKYLVYAVGKAGGEGVGGPDSKLFLFDTSNNQNTPLPAGISNFNQWVSDNKSFITQRFDQKGTNQVVLYSLNDLNNPKVLTPANTSDYLADVSPDGKFVAVTSALTGTQGQQPTQIYLMNLDGSNRKPLTQFTAADQSITGLVWANDGIYYSITTGENKASTWRMDLDGKNAAQVADGTLNAVIGAR